MHNISFLLFWFCFFVFVFQGSHHLDIVKGYPIKGIILNNALHVCLSFPQSTLPIVKGKIGLAQSLVRNVVLRQVGVYGEEVNDYLLNDYMRRLSLHEYITFILMMMVMIMIIIIILIMVMVMIMIHVITIIMIIIHSKYFSVSDWLSITG